MSVEMLTCHETTLQELPELLEILLAHLPDELRKPRINVMVRLYCQEQKQLYRHETKLAHHEIFHWERNGRMVGGLFTMLRPDKTLLALLPTIIAGEPKLTFQGMFKKLIDFSIATDACLIMLLADYQQSADETLLKIFQFQKISNLLYLNSQRVEFPEQFPAKQLTFREYANDYWEEMVTLVEQTYQKTLDFPQLAGLVPTSQILKSYQESHVFEPSLWFFIEYESQVIGALLLTQLEECQYLELTYLGLILEFRGRGFSREIVQFAQFIAKQRDNELIIVSADQNNIPAINTYLRCGFRLHDQKEIYVRFRE
ncbi:MAG: GNAT family N-acetyltransferase [Planctomycetaceae bacterium]|jgi:ribosomal protein S18 acetylase RimI-like enzyme|nr:GNAT family N-acetyltransferase [Planctomycetaceae bacterium]